MTFSMNPKPETLELGFKNCLIVKSLELCILAFKMELTFSVIGGEKQYFLERGDISSVEVHPSPIGGLWRSLKDWYYDLC